MGESCSNMDRRQNILFFVLPLLAPQETLGCIFVPPPSNPPATTTTEAPTTTAPTPAPTTTASTTGSACGPDSCGLECEETSQCVQNQNIQCISSPCCPQWSCLTCPKEMPEINGACDLSEAGLECQYGTQTCCGEEYAVFLMQCTGSQWATIAVETPCMFAGATCAPSPTVCPTIYEPVCGANDVTYSNNCQAAGANVEVSCQGECPCPDCLCNAIFAPVCGADGKTYSNTCFAEDCARVEIQCEQECPCPET